MPPYRVPVAIWRDPQRGFIMLVNGSPVDKNGNPYTEEYAQDRWTYFAGNVVTKEDYEHALETGEWPDTIATTLQPRQGDNLPTDPFERLKFELDDKMKSAEQWLTLNGACKVQADADRLGNLTRELGVFKKQADTMHETEKAPHLEKCREVDAKYRFRDDIKRVTDRIKVVLGAWMKAEEKRINDEREREWRAQEAARIAREAVEQQQRAKQLRDDPIAAMTEPEPEPAPAPIAPPPPVKIQAGGGFGAARGLRDNWTFEWPKEGTEEAYDKALLYHRRHPRIQEALESIIKAEIKAMKDQARTPGIRIFNDRVVA
jgi:hypothetical protein